MVGSEFSRAQMQVALDWCRAEAIDCLYLLSNANAIETARLAEEQGFHLVDIRVTLEKKLMRSAMTEPGGDGAKPGSLPADPRTSIRAARESDIPALRAIAMVSHTDSRFYADGHFQRARCDGLYATWIENSCRGWADLVFVAEHEGSPVGYLSSHVREGVRGEVGLLGVHADARGRGLARNLVEATVDWFAERQLATATVVTQGCNAAAQRLYQSCGFSTASMQLWHHRWFPS
jgi:dTDP-4-amino-4,6-dideoxy-D-galactose acyltransferase